VYRRLADSLQHAVLAKANPNAVRIYGPPAGCVRLTPAEQDSIAVSLAAGLQVALKAAQKNCPDADSSPADSATAADEG
jgi:hypothetical protein